MASHDHNYKNLFSHAKMVEDLLKGFIGADWVKELDYNSLEKLNGSYITDDLRERSDDIVWRVKFRNQWLYVYLLLEFQSTVDPFMAVRMLTYIGLLYQDLIKSKQLPEKGKLPPVLPLVLYNGERPWKAATTLFELLQPMPKALQTWQPQQRYILIDEGRYSLAELEKLENLTAALIRAEVAANREDLIRVLANLTIWLPLPEQAGLRNAFKEWLTRYLLPRRLPGEKINEVNDLTEIQTMLAERVKEWTKDWREEGMKQGLKEGMKEGIKKGIKEGMKQGEQLLITRQLEKRFGKLPEWASAKLQSANQTELETWSERLLDADNLEAVFADTK